MAVAFTEERMDRRIEELLDRRVMSTQPLVDLLKALSQDRAKLAEYHFPTEVVDAFQRRLLKACEDAAEGLGWLEVAEVAKIVGKTPDTVREWCRKGRVLHTDGSRGKRVNVRSALKHAGLLT